MSYTNYENIFTATETGRLAAPVTTHNIEETAILLVTKSLAEANAEEILEIVLNNAFDSVCPNVPRYIQQNDKYDQPLIANSNLTNILSVLDMENNLPAPPKAKLNYLSDHSHESGDESQEEPVFTSPIFVKSGPENINILEVNSIAESHKMSEYSPICEKTSNEKFDIKENNAKCEENNQTLSAKSESRMNIQLQRKISEKEETEYLKNIGDANDTRTIEKIEPEQKVSLTGKVIGDVIPNLSRSDDTELHVAPQVVQAYVLYPGSSANAENTIAANTDNNSLTEMEEDDLELNNLKENSPSTSNEASVETSLVMNEVDNLLNYFEQANNAVDLRVRIVDNPSDKGSENCSTLCEEVKRVVKEIAAAVFEGRGDGKSTELSNLSIQLANRQEQSTPEVQVLGTAQLSNPDPTTMDSEEPRCASKTGEEVVADIQATIRAVDDLQENLSKTQIGRAQSTERLANTDPTQTDSEETQCASKTDEEEEAGVCASTSVIGDLQGSSCKTKLGKAQSPEQLPSPDPTQTDPEASTSKYVGKEEIVIHATTSEESDLQEFLSDMYTQDEIDEREVQVILRDENGETESLYLAAFDSDGPLPTSRKGSQEDLEDNFSYRSVSEINLGLKQSFLDTSRITKVVDEPYSLEKMVKNMEEKNPNIKANLEHGKLRNPYAALCRMRLDHHKENVWDRTKEKDDVDWSTFEPKLTLEEKRALELKRTLEPKPTLGESSTLNEEPSQDENTHQKRRRWRRVRNLLSCFKSKRQSSDEA